MLTMHNSSTPAVWRSAYWSMHVSWRQCTATTVFISFPAMWKERISLRTLLTEKENICQEREMSSSQT